MGSFYKQMAYILAMNPSNRIRELRKKAGLNQAQLAKLAGISQPAISQLENDARPLTLDWMRAIARIFGVAPADLLGDQDNPHRLSPEEQELVDNFRHADDVQRELIGRVAAPREGFRHAERESDRLRA